MSGGERKWLEVCVEDKFYRAYERISLKGNFTL